MIDSFELYSSLWGYSNRITFNRTDADYLIDDDGLDWGEVSSDLSLVNNLDSIGSTLNAVETSKPRSISITGWIVGTETEMEAKKKVLKNILTPQYNLRILIPNDEEPDKNYYIDTLLMDGLKFDSTYKANNEAMCRFSFTLSAPYPFFCLDRVYVGNPGTVLNLGTIPVGVKVVADVSGTHSIQFRSPQKNYYFSLTNDAVGTVTVDTRRGSRIVLLGLSPAFHYLSPREIGDWIQVPPSLTEVTVKTINAEIQNIEFTEAHTALKGM